MSSHREAPSISMDPNADNTDVYAWVDPHDDSKVNLVCNFIPFQVPQGGPNFAEFSDDVVYSINISNSGGAHPNISYEFNFNTIVRDPQYFLYNLGPIKYIRDPHWNRPQYYSVTKVTRTNSGKVLKTQVLGKHLLVPPCNVGARSTPNYEATFLSHAVQKLGAGRQVFAGQRSDSFWVDLGSIFDLGGLRPLNQAHEIPLPQQHGVNGLSGFNVHTIALQVPITELTRSHTRPTRAAHPNAVVGVWSSTHRRRNRVFNGTTGEATYYGAYAQVSRLGNPLFNEVLVGMGSKDRWNASLPANDKNYAGGVAHPVLAELLPTLYPGAFPHLAAYKKPRADLEAILLTGIPYGVLKDKNGKDLVFTTYTGPTQADMLRLNLAIKPTKVGSENELGVLGGDLAGFPNGRRPLDNVVRIELLAIAGATIPLVDPKYTVDTVVANEAGNSPSGKGSDSYFDGSYNNNLPLRSTFPYLGEPSNGYDTVPGTASATTPAGAGQPQS